MPEDSKPETAGPRIACPDCGDPLRRVEIVDATGGATLRYLAGDARTSIWGLFRTLGSVEARICTGCSRILLYGVPREKVSDQDRNASLPIPAEPS
jgi:hypothetical protein